MVLLSHGKESDHENETLDSAGSVAALLLSFRGHCGSVLRKFRRVLSGWLLRRKLLRKQRAQLRLRLRMLQITKGASSAQRIA